VFVPSVMDDDGSTGPLIEAAGARYEYLKVDITAPGSAAQVIDACVERFGRLDVLVNSAGICPMAEVLDFGRPQWDATVRGESHGRLRTKLRGRQAHDSPAQRQDRQHLLVVLVSRRALVVRVRRDKTRPCRLHQGVLR
jgi:hypothetical protein